MENNEATNAQNQQQQGNTGKKRKKNKAGRAVGSLLRFIIWVVIIALAIFLTLYLSAKIAEFPSIGALLDYIWAQFK